MRLLVVLATFLVCAWGATIAPTGHSSHNELDVSAKILREQDASLPPNKRYPSAVLFSRTCGGTIISPTWILTAAHCTLFGSGGSILAGVSNSEDEGVFRLVKRLVVHPLFSVGPHWLDATEFNFNQTAAHWDYMLAELEEPLVLDGELLAAAELDDGSHPLPAGTHVGFAGFGTDHFGGSMRHEMHATDLEIRPDEDCANLEQYNGVHMICTKGFAPKHDTACSGDSGSGLVRDGRVVGVVSWVEEDSRVCEPGKKVALAKVAAAREWIRKVTKV